MTLAESTPVPILQHDTEFDQLLTLYRRRAPRKVLEIGTFHGGTLYHWLRNARTGATVVSIDSYATGVDNRHLYESWTPAGVTLHVIDGDSGDPAASSRAAELGPYDWVFIDAGHYVHEVALDWCVYGSMAARGAVVAFHDILEHPTHPEIQVRKIWSAIVAQGKYETREIVDDPDAEWGGLGLVFV